MAGANTGLSFLGTEAIETNDQGEILMNGEDDAFSMPPESDADDDMDYENPQTGERSRKQRTSESTQPEGSSKRVRVPGGTAPIAKPIKDGYDSDDERIYNLKQQGYTDAYVAQKLVDEGRVRYVPKTISSRYLRIRRVKQKERDDKLDDELSDWHVGEDAFLEECIKAVNQKYDLEMEKLVEKKWKAVADRLADRLEKRKYTQKSCKERWEALRDGTALLPIEVDSDQEGRKVLRETRIAEAKKRRAEIQEDGQREQWDRDAYKRERKSERLQQQQDAKAKKDARDADKAEHRRLQEEKKEGRIQKKAKLQESRALWRAQFNRTREIREREEVIYRHFAGKTHRRFRTQTWKKRVSSGFDEDAEYEYAGSDDDSYISAGEEEYGDNGDASSNVTATPAKKRSSMKTGVTAKTLLNPRSVMSIAELSVLLCERGLKPRGDNETHPQVVARLALADEELPSMTISTLLGKYFDKGKGAKAVKIGRLQKLDAENSAAGQNGVSSTDLEFKRGYEGYAGKFAGLIDDPA